jgi:hypothetical protein
MRIGAAPRRCPARKPHGCPGNLDLQPIEGSRHRATSARPSMVGAGQTLFTGDDVGEAHDPL